MTIGIKMTCCPMCNQPWKFRGVLDQLFALRLTPVQTTILRELLSHKETGRTREQLVFAVYSYSDGPKDPGNVISIQVSRLREALKSHGWTVTKGTRYRLMKLEA